MWTHKAGLSSSPERFYRHITSQIYQKGKERSVGEMASKINIIVTFLAYMLTLLDTVHDTVACAQSSGRLVTLVFYST